MGVKGIQVEQELHYFEEGEYHQDYWLACHGYGQLPQYFVQPFLSKNMHIVAPEAPNTFYLEGFSGRVGANWMTKHHRESDIVNYLGFLNQIVEKTLVESKAKKVLFGFSQGVHTISRFFLDSTRQWDALVLCGAAIPDDVLEVLNLNHFKATKLIIATGEKDQFLSKDKVVKYLEGLRERGVPFFHLSYNDGHKVTKELVDELVKVI